MHILIICFNALANFNLVPLNYSLGTLCHLSTLGYASAASESIDNRMSVQDNGILRTLELLYARSALRMGLSDVWLMAALLTNFFSCSKLVYYESLNKCRGKTNLAFDMQLAQMWNKVCSSE